jgi:UrcA family protein
MPRTQTVACIASAAVLLSATPALAQESRTVKYGELNLNAADGADTLIRRVEHAADVVCGDRMGTQTLRENANVGRCERTSTQNAISDVGHPLVTSRYYGRTPDITIEGSWDPDASVEVRRSE